MKFCLRALWLCAFVLASTIATRSATNDYFAIQVVDEESDRGVPLVELKTVNSISFWTDSNGIVAINEPGLMENEVYFHLQSPGYEFPQDGFKNRGVKLKPRPGQKAKIKIKRTNIAARLYRITGQGIYRDSILIGHPVPLKHPVLDGQVFGQDTVIATPYRGKIYWFWGDTDRPSYPLGNFGASGAYSELPDHGGLDPSVGVELNYFVDANGFTKAMCPIPKGGLHWVESVFTVKDRSGNERLVARMANVPGLARATDWHLLVFNDDKKVFDSIKDWDIHENHVSAHPFLAYSRQTQYLHLFPSYRVPPNLESLAELDRYESFTCVAGDGKLNGNETKVDRDESGHIRYSWKAGADPHYESALIRSGQIRPEESSHFMLDYESGKPLRRQLESVAWNEYRKRWIAFFPDKPGEAWFAEADTPLGPWGYGRRILTHGDYNFYNIAHHPFFDQKEGRLVYFEGTYTAAFSDAKQKTPRYDYNQIMYRLALDDARLSLPIAIYGEKQANGTMRYGSIETLRFENDRSHPESVAWFALPDNRSRKDLIGVYRLANSTSLTTKQSDTKLRPIFCGVSVESSDENPALVILRQFKRNDSRGFLYSVDSKTPEGCEGDGTPICKVWKVPGLAFAADWDTKPVIWGSK